MSFDGVEASCGYFGELVDIFEEWEPQSTKGSCDHNYLYSILYRIIPILFIVLNMI